METGWPAAEAPVVGRTIISKMNMDLRKLPENWYRRPDASYILSQEFIQYFVQLHIVLRDRKSDEPDTCTGFLVEKKDRLFWVTAAHVIDAINYHIDKNNVISLNWIDRFDDPRVPVLKASRKRFHTYSGSSEGFDVGAILLPIYETEHFRNNKSLKPLKIQYSNGDSIINPEGYVFSGFPWTATNIIEQPVNEKQSRFILSTHLLTVPVKKIPSKPDIISGENHWDDPESFFGEVLDFVDIESSKIISNYKGMSGAPIMSFEREEKALHIMFEGVLTSTSQSGKYIRGEPATRVLSKIDNLILRGVNNY